MPSETKPNRDLGVIAKEIRVEEKKNIKSLAESRKTARGSRRSVRARGIPEMVEARGRLLG